MQGLGWGVVGELARERIFNRPLIANRRDSESNLIPLLRRRKPYQESPHPPWIVIVVGKQLAQRSLGLNAERNAAKKNGRENAS